MVPRSTDPKANNEPITFHPDVMAVNAGAADPTVDKCQAAPDTSAQTFDIPLHASPGVPRSRRPPEIGERGV